MPANPTDEMCLAAAQSDGEFDGRGWLAMPRAERERYLERSRKALTAALADHVVGWRDIESAPKDGTHVLVSDGGIVSEAWFDAEAHGGGWYLANRHWTDGPGPDQIFPTHWQPMPSPFAEKK